MKNQIRFLVGAMLYRLGYTICMVGLKIANIDLDELTAAWLLSQRERHPDEKV